MFYICSIIINKLKLKIMTQLAELIQSKLPQGYTLVSESSHKSSSYYYIDKNGIKSSSCCYIDKNGMELIVRTSDHDAIVARSKAHLQILIDMEMHLDLDFEISYDEEDCEIELTNKEVAKQASIMLGCEIAENMISSFDENNLKIDVLEINAKKWDEIISCYIAFKITDIDEIKRY